MKLVGLRVMLLAVFAGCGGGNSTGPTPDFTGTYPGTVTVGAVSAVPAGSTSTAPSPITLTIGLRTDGNYDLSITTPSGGGSSRVVGINAAGAMSFPTFDQASALQLVASLFNGLCATGGAFVTPSGSVQGRTATELFIVTGLTCDWGAGTGVPDVRPTTITFTYQGTKP